MPNYRLIIEYDGAAFHGWQLQDDVHTVQGELGKAIETILRAPTEPLHSSGRTDAGVHARGQVASFRFDGEIPDLPRFAWGVSSILRGKLSVLSAEVAPDDFHPRECAESKQYSYRILNRYPPATIDLGKVWEVQQPLSYEKMRKAAAELIGEHDFSSFRGAGCSANSAVRTIFESDLSVSGPYVTYRVVGSGFLQYMVRIIAGTLVGIGEGSITQSIPEILAARDRSKAGVTAPPHGLYLDHVNY